MPTRGGMHAFSICNQRNVATPTEGRISPAVSPRGQRPARHGPEVVPLHGPPAPEPPHEPPALPHAPAAAGPHAPPVRAAAVPPVPPRVRSSVPPGQPVAVPSSAPPVPAAAVLPVPPRVRSSAPPGQPVAVPTAAPLSPAGAASARQQFYSRQAAAAPRRPGHAQLALAAGEPRRRWPPDARRADRHVPQWLARAHPSRVVVARFQ